MFSYSRHVHSTQPIPDVVSQMKILLSELFYAGQAMASHSPAGIVMERPTSTKPDACGRAAGHASHVAMCRGEQRTHLQYSTSDFLTELISTRPENFNYTEELAPNK